MKNHPFIAIALLMIMIPLLYLSNEKPLLHVQEQREPANTENIGIVRIKNKQRAQTLFPPLPEVESKAWKSESYTLLKDAHPSALRLKKGNAILYAEKRKVAISKCEERKSTLCFRFPNGQWVEGNSELMRSMEEYLHRHFAHSSFNGGAIHVH